MSFRRWCEGGVFVACDFDRELLAKTAALGSCFFVFSLEGGGQLEWHSLKQARQNAERLQMYLAETMEGVPLKIDYRLVWVSGGGAWLEISADRDKVWFISAEGDSKRLWLTQGARLVEGEIKTLVGLLT